MSFEYIYTSTEIDSSLFDIRDVKDYPVLYPESVEDAGIVTCYAEKKKLF